METTQENTLTENITSPPVTTDGDPATNQPETEPQPDSQTPSDAPAEPSPEVDIEQLIAEAEERGYLRGRNESIASLMGSPSASDPSLPDNSTADRGQTLILNNIRPSIWD